jgi:hypothetical protein
MVKDYRKDHWVAVDTNNYPPNDPARFAFVGGVKTDLYMFPLIETVDLDDAELDKYIYVYPNPAMNEVIFAASVCLEKVELFNILGQRVYEQQLKANSTTIEISGFSSGNYIAKLHTSKGVMVKKFVVE